MSPKLFSPDARFFYLKNTAHPQNPSWIWGGEEKMKEGERKRSGWEWEREREEGRGGLGREWEGSERER